MSNNSRVCASDSYDRYQGWWRSTTGGGQRRRLLFCLCSCVSSFVRVSVRLGVHFSCARACAFARCRSACPSACSRRAKAGARRPQRSGCPCAGGTSGEGVCWCACRLCLRARVSTACPSLCARAVHLQSCSNRELRANREIARLHTDATLCISVHHAPICASPFHIRGWHTLGK